MGIFDIFGTGDQEAAAASQKQGLTQGYNALAGQFDQGRNALTTSLANSVVPFQTNLAVGQAGQGAYADATGANGAAGNTRAVNNFQAGPGYQFNMDQMMQNLLRGQEATGQANSGATNTDILTQAHGIADQGWQDYIKNLQPFLNSSNAAAGGIAQANQNAGNQTNQSFTTQGNAAYGTQAGIGNANANADMAGYNASGNLWGLASNALGSIARLGGQKSA